MLQIVFLYASIGHFFLFLNSQLLEVWRIEVFGVVYDLCTGGTWFDSRSRHQISWFEFFFNLCGSIPEFLQANIGFIPWWGHEPLLQNPLPFIIHQSFSQLRKIIRRKLRHRFCCCRRWRRWSGYQEVSVHDSSSCCCNSNRITWLECLVGNIDYRLTDRCVSVTWKSSINCNC